MSGYSVPGVTTQGYDVADGSGVAKFTFVKFTAEGVVGTCTAATDKACGVAMLSVTDANRDRGEGVPVLIDGIAEMEVGTGGIAFGDEVTTDSAGKAVVAATGNRILGQCHRGASAGQRGAVLLNIPGSIKP